MPIKRNVTTCRPFKVLQQILSLDSINFSDQIVLGYVELLIIPLDFELNTLFLNCGSCSISQVFTDGDLECSFDVAYPDVSTAFGSPLPLNAAKLDDITKRECLKNHKHDPEYFHDGNLKITLPHELSSDIASCRSFRLIINFSVSKPGTGIVFAGLGSCPNGEPGEEQTNSGVNWCHLFTVNDGGAWFPSVLARDELCIWRIEMTVDASMQAVCSGDLTETVYTHDMRHKQYTYALNLPTSSLNIGLAVGVFDVWVHPDLPEITSFCLPGLRSLVSVSTSFLDKALEFYQESLSTRFPHTSYKQVFVDMPGLRTNDKEFLVPNGIAYAAFSSIGIFSVSLLHDRRAIDQNVFSNCPSFLAVLTRTVISDALAAQFFGCLIAPPRYDERWITIGLRMYLSGLLEQQFFGHNEHRYRVWYQMHRLCRYEAEHGGVELQTDVEISEDDFLPKIVPVTDEYEEIYMAKSYLIMRIIESKLGGRDSMCQVLNKLLLLGQNAFSGQTTSESTPQRTYSIALSSPAQWQQLLCGITSFSRCVSSLTGLDLNEFLSQRVKPLATGHASLEVHFQFNRRRNMLEAKIKQRTGKGIVPFSGPLEFVVQETDGWFKHTIQVHGEDIAARDIQMHSKQRRQMKKKKIALHSGQEVEVDLSNIDADSPVLWLTADTNLLIIGEIDVQQADYQWAYQLKHEWEALAQVNAVRRLVDFPLQASRLLPETLTNVQLFHRVRQHAAHSIAEIANTTRPSSGWQGAAVSLIQCFKQLFGSHACTDVVRPNLFSGPNIQHYLVQKACVYALSTVRNPNTGTFNVSQPFRSMQCPRNVQTFIMSLLSFNQNQDLNTKSQQPPDKTSRSGAMGGKRKLANRGKFRPFDDSSYRACLLTSLSTTLTPSLRHLLKGRFLPNSNKDNSYDVMESINELCFRLNQEILIPSTSKLVMCACLRGVASAMAFQLIQPDDLVQFWTPYSDPGQCWPVRRCAFECMSMLASCLPSRPLMEPLFQLLESSDQSPLVRRCVAMSMIDNVAGPGSHHGSTVAPSGFLTSLVGRIFNSYEKCDRDEMLRLLLLQLLIKLTTEVTTSSKESTQNSQMMRSSLPVTSSITESTLDVGFSAEMAVASNNSTEPVLTGNLTGSFDAANLSESDDDMQ